MQTPVEVQETVSKESGSNPEDRRHESYRLAQDFGDGTFCTLQQQAYKPAGYSTASDTASYTEAATFPKSTAFISKLWNMLQEAEREGFSHVVSWMPDGHSFRVHLPDCFVRDVVRRYFRQSKYKSFQRQLNLYHFLRITTGPATGGYANPYFIRNKPHLMSFINRQAHNIMATHLLTEQPEETRPASIEGIKISNPQALSFPSAVQVSYPTASAPSASSDLNEVMSDDDIDSIDLHFLKSNDKLLDDFQMDQFFALDHDDHVDVNQGTDLSQTQPESNRKHDPSQIWPAQTGRGPGPSQLVMPGQRYLRHEISTSITTRRVEQRTKIDVTRHSTNNFPKKLYTMLQDAARCGFEHIVSWEDDGRAFVVHDHDEFVRSVMASYFSQTKYDSFRRQLNLYGFTRVKFGSRKGLYRHPCLIRGRDNIIGDIIRIGGN